MHLTARDALVLDFDAASVGAETPKLCKVDEAEWALVRE